MAGEGRSLLFARWRHKSFCTPESYNGASLRLCHNLGEGKFEDVTGKAGLGDRTSKSLGIAILDINNDGWPDILVANDTQPNKLYLNKKDGTFEERGVAAGIGFSEDGVARAGMGVDAADYDRSGHASILISNLRTSCFLPVFASNISSWIFEGAKNN